MGVRDGQIACPRAHPTCPGSHRTDPRHTRDVSERSHHRDWRTDERVALSGEMSRRPAHSSWRPDDMPPWSGQMIPVSGHMSRWPDNGSSVSDDMVAWSGDVSRCPATMSRWSAAGVARPSDMSRRSDDSSHRSHDQSTGFTWRVAVFTSRVALFTTCRTCQPTVPTGPAHRCSWIPLPLIHVKRARRSRGSGLKPHAGIPLAHTVGRRRRERATPPTVSVANQQAADVAKGGDP